MPPAVVAAIFAAIGVKGRDTAEADAPDWAGALIATAGLGLLIWGLTLATTGGKLGFAYAVGGLVAVAVFLAWEKRLGDRAIVPLALFGTPLSARSQC